MRWFGNLSVARLLADMLSTIKGTTADVWAFECADPLLYSSGVVSRDVGLPALLLFCPVTAQYVLLYLAAVASRGHTYFAGSALAIMTWS
jgi:hypothetical protein